MDYRWDRSLREERYPCRRHRENPSFSSTLLDTINRSIDEGGAGGGEEGEQLVLHRETMRKKHSNSTVLKSSGGGGGGFEDNQRACMIDKWMEKKVNEKVRRKSVADFERKSRSDGDSVFFNSCSSSSDSSSGGGFSSSEAESINYGFTEHRPAKPIRTSVSSVHPEKFNKQGREFNMFDGCHHEKNHSLQSHHHKAKHENGFVKTKLKAMKIYGDLKKVKQPISPGRRLASFLNSLFTAKKAKISSTTSGGYDDTSSDTKSKSCSSASSFSRSCLSKTPSSRTKLSKGTKRSVRFYPVSVIVDEDSQPCGHKFLCQDDEDLRNPIDEVLEFRIMETNRRVEEAARDLLKNYQKKTVEYGFTMRNVRNENEEFDNDDDNVDDEDDVASCASSDLFELDNLSPTGVHRYRQELPVYETTHLDTNRAIANGLIS